jgi:hypothetical protein
VKRRALALIGILVLTLAGCGSSDGGGDEIPGGADPAEVQVIEDWADALREGDVEEASGYFEVPSLVQNGTPPLELDSEEDIRLFNESLPCGAKLIQAETEDDFIVATFELTERPGPGECGPGTGNTARTAFAIEDGLIVEWRRVPDEPATEPESTGPIV